MPCPSIPSPPDRRSLSRAADLRPWRAPSVLALAVVVAVGGPRLATSAEPEAEDKARALYQAGNQAFSAGQYGEAYRQWEEGYRLSPRPLFLVNMAHAERRRGELGKARVLYQKFLLVDPQSPLRAEVEAVIAEINGVLPAETSPAAPPEAPFAGAPAASAAGVDLTPPPVTEDTSSAPLVDIGAATPAPADAPPPFYRRWWFWTGVGAVVVGAVAVGLLAGGQDGPPRQGSLGTLGAAP